MPPFVRWLKVFFAFLLGLGYYLQPEVYANTSTFVFVRETAFGVRGWGVLFMICAILMAWTKIYGCAISAIVWLIWGLLLIASAQNGLLASWGAAVWPFFFASLNAGEAIAGFRDLRRSNGEPR